MDSKINGIPDLFINKHETLKKLYLQEHLNLYSSDFEKIWNLKWIDLIHLVKEYDDFPSTVAFHDFEDNKCYQDDCCSNNYCEKKKLNAGYSPNQLLSSRMSAAKEFVKNSTIEEESDSASSSLLLQENSCNREEKLQIGSHTTSSPLQIYLHDTSFLSGQIDGETDYKIETYSKFENAASIPDICDPYSKAINIPQKCNNKVLRSNEIQSMSIIDSNKIIQNNHQTQEINITTNEEAPHDKFTNSNLNDENKIKKEIQPFLGSINNFDSSHNKNDAIHNIEFELNSNSLEFQMNDQAESKKKSLLNIALLPSKITLTDQQDSTPIFDQGNDQISAKIMKAACTDLDEIAQFSTKSHLVATDNFEKNGSIVSVPSQQNFYEYQQNYQNNDAFLIKNNNFLESAAKSNHKNIFLRESTNLYSETEKQSAYSKQDEFTKEKELEVNNFASNKLNGTQIDHEMHTKMSNKEIFNNNLNLIEKPFSLECVQNAEEENQSTENKFYSSFSKTHDSTKQNVDNLSSKKCDPVEKLNHETQQFSLALQNISTLNDQHWNDTAQKQQNCEAFLTRNDGELSKLNQNNINQDNVLNRNSQKINYTKQRAEMPVQEIQNQQSIKHVDNLDLKIINSKVMDEKNISKLSSAVSVINEHINNNISAQNFNVLVDQNISNACDVISVKHEMNPTVEGSIAFDKFQEINNPNLFIVDNIQNTDLASKNMKVFDHMSKISCSGEEDNNCNTLNELTKTTQKNEKTIQQEFDAFPFATGKMIEDNSKNLSINTSDNKFTKIELSQNKRNSSNEVELKKPHTNITDSFNNSTQCIKTNEKEKNYLQNQTKMHFPTSTPEDTKNLTAKNELNSNDFNLKDYNSANANNANNTQLTQEANNAKINYQGDGIIPNLSSVAVNKITSNNSINDEIKIKQKMMTNILEVENKKLNKLSQPFLIENADSLNKNISEDSSHAQHASNLKKTDTKNINEEHYLNTNTVKKSEIGLTDQEAIRLTDNLIEENMYLESFDPNNREKCKEKQAQKKDNQKKTNTEVQNHTVSENLTNSPIIITQSIAFDNINYSSSNPSMEDQQIFLKGDCKKLTSNAMEIKKELLTNNEPLPDHDNNIQKEGPINSSLTEKIAMEASKNSFVDNNAKKIFKPTIDPNPESTEKIFDNKKLIKVFDQNNENTLNLNTNGCNGFDQTFSSHNNLQETELPSKYKEINHSNYSPKFNQEEKEAKFITKLQIPEKHRTADKSSQTINKAINSLGIDNRVASSDRTKSTINNTSYNIDQETNRTNSKSKSILNHEKYKNSVIFSTSEHDQEDPVEFMSKLNNNNLRISKLSESDANALFQQKKELIQEHLKKFKSLSFSKKKATKIGYSKLNKSSFNFQQQQKLNSEGFLNTSRNEISKIQIISPQFSPILNKLSCSNTLCLKSSLISCPNKTDKNDNPGNKKILSRRSRSGVFSQSSLTINTTNQTKKKNFFCKRYSTHSELIKN